MKFVIREVLLCLMAFLVNSSVKAQEPIVLPTPPIQSESEDRLCSFINPPLVEIDVSVSSGRKSSLKDLTYKNFEIYDEKEFREIVFFKFDKLKNQYTIGFYQDEYIPENKWRNVKIKLNLSKEKKKDYGKIFVKAQKGYYPKDAKRIFSKILKSEI